MTNQEKKFYLMRYRAADREITDLLNRRDEVKSRLERMTPTYSGMPGGGGDSDKMTNGVAKLIELEKEIDAKTDHLVDFQHEIESYIDLMNSEKEKRLMKLRYLDGKTFDRIALDMNYERRQINRIHGFALMHIEIPEDVL